MRALAGHSLAACARRPRGCLSDTPPRSKLRGAVLRLDAMLHEPPSAASVAGATCARRCQTPRCPALQQPLGSAAGTRDRNACPTGAGPEAPAACGRAATRRSVVPLAAGAGCPGTSVRSRPSGSRWSSGGRFRWTACGTTLRSSLAQDDRFGVPPAERCRAPSLPSRTTGRPAASAPEDGEGRGTNRR